MVMKKLALDTNVVIAIINGNETIAQLVAQYNILCLPVTVCGELLFGAKNAARSRTYISVYRNFIDSCEIIDINDVVAEEYSNIRLELKLKGNPIPENDIWIAAICTANELPLLTLDKHFKNIDTLELAPI
jgi:tRNA(fMet)-specific endonuclease VapC